MSDHTITRHNAPIDIAVVERRLRAQLTRSEAQLVELESVLTDLLRGRDTIQEDCDGTRLVVDALRDDVRQIRSALTRLADGVYGRCTACGSTIPKERLDAIPTVAHCTRCA